MILSASRRTDIPNYYSEWFFNRMKEGFVYVRNPMNCHQVSRVPLSPELVDCIVFWTKNPEPMLGRLGELGDLPYYVQFTLTGCGRDMEPNLPDKKAVLIPVFQRLSQMIGRERVIWRYDPILVSERYTAEYHLWAFREIARLLEGYTDRVVISFLDFYAKIRTAMNEMGVRELADGEIRIMASAMARTAAAHGMEIVSCTESIDLSGCGVRHGSCIDGALIERIIGMPLQAGPDKNQRSACGCVESIDIGMYHTCRNGCRYCYANDSSQRVEYHSTRYDPKAPLLCGVLGGADKITERKVKSFREAQLCFGKDG